MKRHSSNKTDQAIKAASFNDKSDPYLIWANETNFRDFSVSISQDSNEYFQVAVQTTGENPIPIDANRLEWPVRGLRTICESKNAKSMILTGIVSRKDLQRLNDECELLEINVARYKNSQSINSADSIPPKNDSKLPKISKRVMAVIDYGCPFANRQFWDYKNKTTRVRYFWDQDNTFPLNFKGSQNADQYWFKNTNMHYGRETNSEVLKKLFNHCKHDGILDEERVYELSNYSELMQESSSHGAHVMDLAAGRVNPMTGLTDDASDSDIIFVQLPRGTVDDSSGGSMTMFVLDALKYILDKTKEVDQLVINMSFGSTAGPHDGSSLLERGIDMLIEQRREDLRRTVELVLPAGNHFLADLHGQVTLTKEKSRAEFLWEIMPDDPTESYLELWCLADSNIEVKLTSPSGSKHVLKANQKKYVPSDNAELALIRATNSSNGENEVVLIALSPTNTSKTVRVEAGVWSIETSIRWTKNITVNAWVERDDAVSWQSGQPQCRLLSSRAERLIYSPDVQEDAVKRERTGNSLAFGKTPNIASGYIVKSNYALIEQGVVLSHISAAGPFDAKRSYLAPTDESEMVHGILASGNLSDTWARMDGTSVAAPQVARQLLNGLDKRRIRNVKPCKSTNDLRLQQGIALQQVF
jgi:hypothetical protein